MKTGLAAGSLAMLEFFSWGCRDFLKARLGRAQPCGRVWKAALSQGPKGAAFIDKANKMYGFLGPVDKVLYAWLVADIASTFVARWTSMAYASAGCFPSEQQNSYQYVLAGPFGMARDQDAIIPYTLAAGELPGPGAGFDAPSGWYFQIYFQIRCHPLFSNGIAQFDTTLEEHIGHFNFDFEANPNKSWYAGRSLSGRWNGTMHNTKPISVRYLPKIIAHEDLICNEGKASVITSPLPILGSHLQPLSCFKHDLTGYFPELFPD